MQPSRKQHIAPDYVQITTRNKTKLENKSKNNTQHVTGIVEAVKIIKDSEDDKMSERKKSAKEETCTLSVFACACAVLSLLVQTYDFVGVDVKCERDLVENVLEEKFKEKLEAYLSDVTGFTSLRMKREAMLVSFGYLPLV